MEEKICCLLDGICCYLCCLRFADSGKLSSLRHYEYLSEQPAAKRRKKCACVTCFDLLSADNVQYVIDQASECLLKDNYDDTVFTMTLSMPVSTGIREYGVYLYLSCTIPDYQAHLPWQRLPTIKDIWKQLTSAAVGRRVDKRADSGYHAELQVNVVLNYRGDRRETLVIEKLRRLSSQRGGDAHGSSGAVTRMMVESVLTAYHQQQQQQQQQLVPCPPLAPVHPASYTITCSRASLFLAGRYNKYSRHLSQTPWLVGGQRREGVASSVLEMLSQRIIQLTRASDVKFSSSGREDVDVRTLGDGRPFVLELLQPHVTRLTWHDLRSLQTHINSTHRDIHVRHLQIVNRESTQRLKQGEQHKTKTYTVLVRCIAPAGDGGVQCALCGQHCVGAVCERRLARLRRLRNLVLWQQTPVRVLHRRPMARRRRLVHSITAVPLTNSLFKLYLSTQAGTYIKEFVHGDFGRTHPSLTSLLAADDATFDVIVSANDVTESANEIIRSANGDIGSASDVTGSTNEMNGSANDVTGSANEINGSANDVTGSANEINGLANDVTRSANDVIYSSVPPTTQYDIVALDVESVQLDWPPAVSYERVDTHSDCPLSCGDICTANCGTIDADVVRSGVEAGADKAGIVAKRVCSDARHLASDSLQQEEYNSCSDED